MGRDKDLYGEMTQLLLARRDAFAAARDLYVTFKLGFPESVCRTSTPYDSSRPVFIQYLNPEVLACYGLQVNGNDADLILRNALRATRLAVLITESYLVLPSSHLFEVSWFDLYLRITEPLVADGRIHYTGPMKDLDAYRHMKASEYRRDSANPYLTWNPRRSRRLNQLPWTSRSGGSTAVDISDQWRLALSSTGELHWLVRSIANRRYRSYSRAERVLARVPDRLDGQAFIKRFVEDTLPTEPTPPESSSLAFFLSKAYLESYVLDLNAMILIDFPIADLSCNVERHKGEIQSRTVSVRAVNAMLKWLGLYDFVYRIADWTELLELKSSPEFRIVASAMGNSSRIELAVALLAARKSSHFRNAESGQEAATNSALVAEGLAPFVVPPGRRPENPTRHIATRQLPKEP